VTTKTIFRTGCLAVLAAALTGCGPGPADSGGDEFRILLEAWTGADHADKAVSMKALIERDGFRDLTLVTKQNMTELYMGRYASAEATQKDLQKVRAYTNAQWDDVRPFDGARLILMQGRDVGPPEWNLLNVHPRYAYTVVIMIYHDEDRYIGRRQQAVDMCRKLREEGELAFFHHGPRNSSVCVGLFKINAVRVRQAPVHDPRGALAPRGTVAGTQEKRVFMPEIQAVLQRYPRIYVNGDHEKLTVPTTEPLPGNPRTGSWKEFYAPSYVIDVPRRPSAGDPFAGVGDS